MSKFKLVATWKPPILDSNPFSDYPPLYRVTSPLLLAANEEWPLRYVVPNLTSAVFDVKETDVKKIYVNYANALTEQQVMWFQVRARALILRYIDSNVLSMASREALECALKVDPHIIDRICLLWWADQLQPGRIGPRNYHLLFNRPALWLPPESPGSKTYMVSEYFLHEVLRTLQLASGFVTILPNLRPKFSEISALPAVTQNLIKLGD